MLLEVTDLRLSVRVKDREALVLAGVSLRVDESESWGIVGETGSGKSLTARAIMRLLPAGARITSGRIALGGKDLLALAEEEMRAIRGHCIALIPQNPSQALSPVETVGAQMRRVLSLQRGISKREAGEWAAELLASVGIDEPKRMMAKYPHELSGGMLQRVLIATAVACEPELLLADEPTTGLDLIVQAQVLELLREGAARMGASLVLISHDLSVITETCTHIAVMYAGRIVESGGAHEVLAAPLHPYTKDLIAAAQPPKPGRRWVSIPGNSLSVLEKVSGCPYRLRCRSAMSACAVTYPETLLRGSRWVECHLYD